jgi:hypothetical protein
MAGQYYEWQQNPSIYRGSKKREKVEIYNLMSYFGGHTTPLPVELRIAQEGEGKPHASIFVTFRADFTLKHLVTALEVANGLEEQHREVIDDKVLTEVKVRHDVAELKLEEKPSQDF